MFCCLQPLSLEQLSVWEPGGGLRTWLEGVEVCAVHFCALARQENHELTELLQNYWRCRRQLTQSHTQLHTQSSECKSTQSRLWSFRDEQLTLQVRREIRQKKKHVYIVNDTNSVLMMPNFWRPFSRACVLISPRCVAITASSRQTSARVCWLNWPNCLKLAASCSIRRWHCMRTQLCCHACR